MATFDGVYGREKDRVSNLKYCSEYGAGVITSGDAPDGVCAVDWTYLSPAAAKLAPSLSEQQIESFKSVRKEYDKVCGVIEGKVGAESRRISLCGADWTWLDKADSALKLKAGKSRALGVIGQP
jgi:hypothetical protein